MVQKNAHDFLLLFHIKCGPIFYRFALIAGIGQNLLNLYIPPVLNAPVRVTLFEFHKDIYYWEN